MNTKNITDVYKAIADPTRREIINLLSKKNMLTINEITDNFKSTRQGITKHIYYLSSAGLVSVIPKGRKRICKADLKPLEEIHQWLSKYEKFWHGKLTALEDFLNKKQ
jgi:DNA-binding transcriptional ArsR family regulator